MAYERIGVLLVNLGTPDAPSYLAVQRYLREFLGDRRVIDTSRWLWLPLLYGLILPLRPLRTARKYRKIWMPGGSPLALYSRRLADKVGAALQASLGDGVRVELGMSYGRPALVAAIERLDEQSVRRLLVLPLYPQYCKATSGSVSDRMGGVLKRLRSAPALRIVKDYHRDPAFIAAWTGRIAKSWEERGERSHLLLAYHGIPLRYVKEGDPYHSQAQTTTALIVEQLGLRQGEFSHCYQSRFGRLEWLQPYLGDTLKDLLERGIRKVTVVSPSFAVDCLETLEELGIGYQEQYLSQGGERFDLLACLNDDDRHAELLAALIRQHLADWGSV
jgi:protoporphyrin/coproporphyrin ferrochelatase